jgi:hypothetical protein
MSSSKAVPLPVYSDFRVFSLLQPLSLALSWEVCRQFRAGFLWTNNYRKELSYQAAAMALSPTSLHKLKALSLIAIYGHFNIQPLQDPRVRADSAVR